MLGRTLHFIRHLGYCSCSSRSIFEVPMGNNWSYGLHEGRNKRSADYLLDGRGVELRYWFSLLYRLNFDVDAFITLICHSSYEELSDYELKEVASIFVFKSFHSFKMDQMKATLVFCFKEPLNTMLEDMLVLLNAMAWRNPHVINLFRFQADHCAGSESLITKVGERRKTQKGNIL